MQLPTRYAINRMSVIDPEFRIVHHYFISILLVAILSVAEPKKFVKKSAKSAEFQLVVLILWCSKNMSKRRIEVMDPFIKKKRLAVPFLLHVCVGLSHA